VDGLRFVGIPCADRDPPSAEDYRRLAARIQATGFTLCDHVPSPADAPSNGIGPADAAAAALAAGGTLHVWRDGFVPIVALDDLWIVCVVDPWTPATIDRSWIDPLVPLIAAVTEVADTYVGWVSSSEDDDLWFVVEDPPFELTEPLAVVYLGGRYLDDNGVPAFAAGADLDLTLPNGRLIVPSFAELA
jgi:hypothetical protein